MQYEDPGRRKHRGKTLGQKNVDHVNSSLCEENYTLFKAVDKLKI